MVIIVWFKIIKQGKILTLPKTKLRIKKPIKEEVDRDCKDKLLQYNDKLDSLGHSGGVLRPIYDKYVADNDLFQINSGGNTTIYQEAYMTMIDYKPWKDEMGSYFAQEEILVSRSKYIERLPEKVCCEALDMLAKSTTHTIDDDFKGDEKLIDNWEITVFNQSTQLAIGNALEFNGQFSRLLLSISSLDMSDSYVEMGHTVWLPNTWGDEKGNIGQDINIDWR